MAFKFNGVSSEEIKLGTLHVKRVYRGDVLHFDRTLTPAPPPQPPVTEELNIVNPLIGNNVFATANDFSTDSSNLQVSITFYTNGSITGVINNNMVNLLSSTGFADKWYINT